MTRAFALLASLALCAALAVGVGVWVDRTLGSVSIGVQQ